MKESCKWYLSCTKLLKTKIWKLKELGVSQKYENNKPKKGNKLRGSLLNNWQTQYFKQHLKAFVAVFNLTNNNIS